MFKIYKTNGNLSTTVRYNESSFRIRFTSNSIGDQGIFTTSNDKIQLAIETDKRFGSVFFLGKGYSKTVIEDVVKEEHKEEIPVVKPKGRPKKEITN